MGDVRLVDLEIIKRYSLAVRRDTVPAGELLEALDASRVLVVAALAAEADGSSTPAVTPALSDGEPSRPDGEGP